LIEDTDPPPGATAKALRKAGGRCPIAAAPAVAADIPRNSRRVIRAMNRTCNRIARSVAARIYFTMNARLHFHES